MPAILDFNVYPHRKATYSLHIFQSRTARPQARSSSSYDLSDINQFEINRRGPDPADAHSLKPKPNDGTKPEHNIP